MRRFAGAIILLLGCRTATVDLESVYKYVHSTQDNDHCSVHWITGEPRADAETSRYVIESFGWEVRSGRFSVDDRSVTIPKGSSVETSLQLANAFHRVCMRWTYGNAAIKADHTSPKGCWAIETGARVQEGYALLRYGDAEAFANRLDEMVGEVWSVCNLDPSQTELKIETRSLIVGGAI